MQDNTIIFFSMVICSIAFFIFPLYTAFSLKDSLDYAQALKVTTDFVKEVTNRGYITLEMYRELKENLSATGNSYKIAMQHIHRTSIPIIYAYSDSTQQNIIGEFEFSKYARSSSGGYTLPSSISVGGKTYSYLSLGYKQVDEYIFENEIVDFLEYYATASNHNDTNPLDEKFTVYTSTFSQYVTRYPFYFATGLNAPVSNSISASSLATLGTGKVIAYKLNLGDVFNIKVVNTNGTIATSIYSSVVAKVGNTVYINFGGTVTGNVDIGEVELTLG